MMRKVIVVFFLIAVSFFYVVIQSDTKKYATYEAIKICSWLNSDKAEIDFRVGPYALEHLQEFKNSGLRYTCEVTSSTHMYGYKDEIAVVIRTKGQDTITLIYGLGSGGRNFYQPRYFQHWTGNKLRHHE